MSNVADAIRIREESKRPIVFEEPKPKRSRKARVEEVVEAIMAEEPEVTVDDSFRVLEDGS